MEFPVACQKYGWMDFQGCVKNPTCMSLSIFCTPPGGVPRTATLAYQQRHRYVTAIPLEYPSTLYPYSQRLVGVSIQTQQCGEIDIRR